MKIVTRWCTQKIMSLISASEEGDLTTLSRLLNDGADIEAKDGSQRSALHAAAARGQIEALDFLIREASK